MLQRFLLQGWACLNNCLLLSLVGPLSSVCRPFVVRLNQWTTKLKMPARNHAEPWVLTLRNTLKQAIGPAYRVRERRGRVCIDIRHSNGTRSYATLDIPWLPINSRTIQHKVEQLAGLISSGYTSRDAVQQSEGVVPAAPASNGGSSTELLLLGTLGELKVGLNKITAKTWNEAYKSGIIWGCCIP